MPSSKKSLSLAAVLLAVPIVAGPQTAAAPQDPESPPPITTHGSTEGSTQSLPSGHPPVSSPSGFTVMEVPADSGTGDTALTWTVPEGWVEEAPSSSMRRAQYRVPGPEGDGQCIVYYFGPGQGGDAASNAQRWAEQFAQADGRPSTEVMKTEDREVAGVEVMVVEVTGDYGGGMGGQPIADAMLLGAIARGPDANWFFKLTGPESTLRGQKEAFDALIGSIRGPG